MTFDKIQNQIFIDFFKFQTRLESSTASQTEQRLRQNLPHQLYLMQQMHRKIDTISCRVKGMSTIRISNTCTMKPARCMTSGWLLLH